MNAIAERWIGGCRRELLDRTLVWNQAHLRQILREYEIHHNRDRRHCSLHAAAPLKPLPEPVDLEQYRVRRQARTGGRGGAHAGYPAIRATGEENPAAHLTTPTTKRIRSARVRQWRNAADWPRRTGFSVVAVSQRECPDVHPQIRQAGHPQPG
jgi:hypothetical protein